MKRWLFFCLAVILLAGGSSVHAFSSPEVAPQSGEVGLRALDGEGLLFTAQYGFSPSFGVIVQVGSEDFGRLGAKYGLNENMAIAGGATRSEKAFLGAMFATGLAPKLQGLAETVFITCGEELSFNYQLNLKYQLNWNLDLRAGIKSVDFEFPRAQIGIGYSF